MPDSRSPAAETTTDEFLGGRLRLRQPRRGYRAGADAVLLAAAGEARGQVLDVGAGVGTVGLCLARRCPAVRVTLLEREPALAALAEANAAANDLADRAAVVRGDILARPRPVPMHRFDQVLCNPPFHEPARAPGSAEEARRTARTEGEAALADWVAFCLAALKPGGRLTLVHRAERLPELLGLLRGRAGGMVVFPLWPRAGEAAKSVLLRAVKQSKAPARLAAGLVLHEADSRYTASADAVLRDAAGLALEA